MDIEKYLSNFFRGTKNPSLKAMKFLMEEFNHPENTLKAIHIAGTNGKGSVTEMITNVLIKEGYTVGKFISPHLIHYNERISVNNNNILHIIKKADISNYSFDNNFQYFDYKNFKNIIINLKGKVQVQNACLCIEVFKILNTLGYNINLENIINGLKTVIHKGRMEQLNDKPLIIFDGAHNEPAIKNLQDMIKMYYKKMKRVYIISILKRKDYNKMLKLISEDKDAVFILTSGNNQGIYASSDELYECMKQFTDTDKIYKKKLEDAIEDAKNANLDTVSFILVVFIHMEQLLTY